MDMLKICGIAMLCLGAVWVLKQYKGEMVFPVRAAGTILIFFLVLSAAQPIVDMIKSLCEQSLPTAHGEILLSGLGITLLSALGAGICRDFGESGLAMAVESAGKIAVVLQALPLIAEILDMTKGLLS
jgi:stage III sporulation protein AD